MKSVSFILQKKLNRLFGQSNTFTSYFPMFMPPFALFSTLANSFNVMGNISGHIELCLSCFLLYWQPKLVICNSLCHMLGFVCMTFVCVPKLPDQPTTAQQWEVRVSERWNRFPRVLKINQVAATWITHLSIVSFYFILPVSFHDFKAFLRVPNINSRTSNDNVC